MRSEPLKFVEVILPKVRAIPSDASFYDLLEQLKTKVGNRDPIIEETLNRAIYALAEKLADLVLAGYWINLQLLASSIIVHAKGDGVQVVQDALATTTVSPALGDYIGEFLDEYDDLFLQYEIDLISAIAEGLESRDLSNEDLQFLASLGLSAGEAVNKLQDVITKNNLIIRDNPGFVDLLQVLISNHIFAVPILRLLYEDPKLSGTGNPIPRQRKGLASRRSTDDRLPRM